jgi:hypothetical protein
LDYITGHRNVTSNYWINQKGVNLDGPLFPVPAGDVKAAIGAEYTTESFLFTFYDNTSSATLVVPSLAASAHKEFWATFAQLNVPVIGEPNSIPLVRRVDIEASWRHDQYSDVGGTSNQKVAFNWTLSEDYGITLRGAWGTSFRAPTFAEQVALVKSAIAAQNSNLFPQAQSIASGVVTSGGCTFNTNSMADRLVNPGPGLVGWSGVVGQGGISGQTCGANAQPIGMSVLGAAGIAIDAGMRDYVNIAQKTVRPETAMNWAATIEFSPTAILRGLDVQATWYQVKINDALVNFANPNTTSVNDSTLGFSYIVPTDIAKAVIANPALVPAGYRQTAAQVIAGCSNNNTPTACGPFEDMVAALLANPRNPVPSAVQTSVVWINDGTTGNFGWLKLQGIDFNASYDVDVGDFGAFNAGIVGTYYLHQYKVNDVTAANPEAGIIQDQYHTTLGTLGGIPQVGVESLPQLRYRARLGWSNGPISVTGFMDYQGHFFSTQSAPPNVNFQCTTTGGTIGGGTLPCAISNYTDIEPSYYTFDLSFGYDTGDTPADFYLKHLNIQVVVQNIMDRRPAFEYRISTGAGNPATFDITKSLQGRTIGVILTKTW